MVWLRESPDPKHRLMVTKVIVGKKIQCAVMSVPVRFRPAVPSNRRRIGQWLSSSLENYRGLYRCTFESCVLRTRHAIKVYKILARSSSSVGQSVALSRRRSRVRVSSGPPEIVDIQFSTKIKLNRVMSTSDQQNGNTQLNSERSNFNRKVSVLSILGKTKKVQWDGKRRYRTI